MTIADGIRHLVRIGIEPDYSFSKRIRIELTNIMALLTIPVLLSTIFIELFYGVHTWELYLDLSWFILAAIPLYLNHIKKHHWAQITLTIGSFIYSGLIYSLYGTNLLIEPLYLTFILCTICFFDRTTAFFIILFAFTTYFGAQYSWRYNDALLGPYINQYSNTFSFVYSVITIWIALHRLLAENRTYRKLSNQQNTLLSLQNEELQRFAYVTAHDLKTPLRNLNNYLGLIKLKRNKKENDIDEYINNSQENANRLFHLINDILDFTKIRQAVISPEQVDMEPLIEEIKKDYSFDIQNGKVSIRYENLDPIYFDKIQLKILLHNLIDNAIKYNNSSLATVDILTEKTNKSLILKIADNGIGISEEYKDQVFTMFTRLHTQSEYSGSGLGLSIVKRIVESHNGQIDIESYPDQGSLFCITVPA